MEFNVPKLVFVNSDGKEKSVEAENGISLMEVARDNDLGIEGRFYELNELPVYKDEIVQRLTSEKNKEESKLVKYANEQRSLLKKFYLAL